MPNTDVGEEGKPVISHENASKNTGRLWVSTVLTGVLLLVVGLILVSSAGPSLVAMVLIPTGVACFLVAAVIKPLEAIHAELMELNGKR